MDGSNFCKQNNFLSLFLNIYRQESCILCYYDPSARPQIEILMLKDIWEHLETSGKPLGDISGRHLGDVWETSLADIWETSGRHPWETSGRPLGDIWAGLAGRA